MINYCAIYVHLKFLHSKFYDKKEEKAKSLKNTYDVLHSVPWQLL